MIEVIIHYQRPGGTGGDGRSTFSDENLADAEAMLEGARGYDSGFYSGSIEHISAEGRVVLKYIEDPQFPCSN